jgi:hypothetical protein
LNKDLSNLVCPWRPSSWSSNHEQAPHHRRTFPHYPSSDQAPTIAALCQRDQVWSAVPLHLFINLEYRDAGEWDYLAHPSSAFALAAKDSVLRDAGLASDSVGDAHRFFDLYREELADFSWVCGGSINNNEMADRIERIAARSAI